MRGSIVILIIVSVLMLTWNYLEWQKRGEDLRSIEPIWERDADVWDGISLSPCVIGPPNHCEDKS